ncbi:MAG: hypothetical protein C0595_12370 [Marinilabiliales bacterium]|nr:MAG: hypothetical protein C0595_12370 [Marinilabiliales bacterium]
MKPIKPLLLIILSYSFLLVSCTQSKFKSVDNEPKTQVNLLQKPLTHKLIYDSITINIPNNGKNDKIEIVRNKLPKKTTFTFLNKIIPGESNLPLSLKEKVEGVTPTKTKYPKITIINEKTINSKKRHAADSVRSIKLGENYLISYDSIEFFKRIIKAKNLYSIQNGDTLYPPLSFYSTEPEQTKAQAFRYKDDAVFDISYLGAEQGLPNSYIRCIRKDNKGVLWLATHTGGLISYDGQFYRHYSLENGLSDNQVVSFIIDRDNNFWLGTMSGGLNFFDGNKFVRYTTRQGLPSNMVLSLEEGENGEIWIGTAQGLVRFNGKEFKVYTTKQGLPYNVIITLKRDNQGNLWVGTYGGGLAKWDGEKFTNYNADDGLAADLVLAIHQDYKGNIWIGTEGGGVSKLEGKEITNFTQSNGLLSNNVLAITETSDSLICFGTFGEGLVVYDGEGFLNYSSKEGLSDDYIRALYYDETGNLWIGTDGAGLIKFNTRGFANFTVDQGLPDNLVVSGTQDMEGGVWLGAFHNGIMYFDDPPKLGKHSDYINITPEQGLVHETVVSILQDSKGNIWFGTFGGGVSKLIYDELKKGRIEIHNITTKQGLLSNAVRDIIEDNEGNFWFATDHGLTRYKDGKLETFTTKAGLKGNKITCLFQDNKNAIWFGTIDGGVSKIENDIITTYTSEQGLSAKSVWAVKQDKNGIIWLGTENNGLWYFNGKSFHYFKEESGLCNNAVFSLTIYNDNLWVGTTKGLSQIYLDQLIRNDGPEGDYYDKPVILNYGKQDGLKSLDFYHESAFVDNNNFLWLGSVKALSTIDLTKLEKPEVPPIAHIEKILINGNTIDFVNLQLDKKKYLNQDIRFSGLSPFLISPIDLSLPVEMNHLTFSYCATDWLAPHKIMYQFKLEGYDKNWSNETSENLVDYKNLSPGKYIFKLRAKGSNQVWGDTLEYKFEIRNPWWLSWWAFIIYLLGILALIWLVIHWRVSIVKQQKIILERLIGKRTEELKQALVLADQAAIAKSQFIANMSHEIRTPLTAIMGLTNLALDTNKDTKITEYLYKINGSASNMLVLINDLLDFSKIEAGKLQFEELSFNLQDVLNNTLLINSKLIREKDIELVFMISPDVPENLLGDQVRVGQVISNLVNNAIKFTEKGKVIVGVSVVQSLENDNVELQISVKDNGIGIEEQHIKFIFNEFEQADNSITRKYGGSGLGLAICKSLVGSMDGKIWVESKINQGSTFYFTMQLQKDKNVTDINIPVELTNLNTVIFDNDEQRAHVLSQLLEYYSLNSKCFHKEESFISETMSVGADLLILDAESLKNASDEFIDRLQENANENETQILLISNSEESSKEIISRYTYINNVLIRPLLPIDLLNKLLSLFSNIKEEISRSRESEIDYDQIKSKVKGKNILVVEDNELVRELVFELLTKVGVNVTMAENGALALDILDKKQFDLVFMDMHMPVMDGFTASKQIRDTHISTPIIILTADTSASLIEETKDVGVNDLITKPIDTVLFYKVLLTYIVNTTKKDVNFSSAKNVNTNKIDLQFKELDAKSGIRRFGDNKKLYLKILHKFMYSKENICIDIKQLVDSGDFKDAYIKCHSLKGETANISADNVFRVSEKLESSILKEDIVEINSDIVVLEESLKDLMDELHLYFDNLSKDNTHKTDINIILKEIIESLNKRDPKVFDLLDQLINYKIDRKVLESLDSALSNGDNEKAMEILNSLIEKFKLK